MKPIILLLAILALAGCATQIEKQAATDAFYTGQARHDTAVATAAANVKPVCELEGIPGQSINISGVSAFRCYASGGNNQQAAFQAAPAQQSEFAAGLHEVRETVLGVMPYALGAAAIRGVTRLGDNIQNGSTAGYAHVQSPAASYTYGANSGANSGNSGNLAGTGSTVTAPIATATPTVVNQPAPVVVLAPNPVIVPATTPIVVQPCVVAASGVGGCL